MRASEDSLLLRDETFSNAQVCCCRRHLSEWMSMAYALSACSMQVRTMRGTQAHLSCTTKACGAAVIRHVRKYSKDSTSHVCMHMTGQETCHWSEMLQPSRQEQETEIDNPMKATGMIFIMHPA